MLINLGGHLMIRWKKIVFLMVPVFLLVSLFSAVSFAGGKKNKKWKKETIEANWGGRNDAYEEDWRDEIRYSQGHHHRDCNLPPGLAKKGKVPPGWAKKCRHQPEKHQRKHHAKKHQEHYPDHDHHETTGGHDNPSGEIDIGIGVRIPLP